MSDTLTEVQLCSATTKAGSPCKGAAVIDGLCMSHSRPKKEKPAPKPRAETPKAESKTLKPYPFHDGGVNENAAIRMIAMVIPNCPVDGTPEIKGRDGTWHPNPNYTGEQNCQQVYRFNPWGRWDVEKCISLGHDPYHTTKRKAIQEETVDENGYITGTRTRYKLEKNLNIIQVSDNARHSSGDEVRLATARGCKFLEDFGYASPCEFRSCSEPQNVDTLYGKYCSERHARLIAADKRLMVLPVGGDPYSEDQAMREREDMLNSINIRKGG